MELLIKGRISTITSYNNGHTTLSLSEQDLLKLKEAIDFHYFDEDFHNFLELEHESTRFADGCELSTLKRFWELYKDAQDMNIAEWDTFKSVYENDFQSTPCYERNGKQIPITSFLGGNNTGTIFRVLK